MGTSEFGSARRFPLGLTIASAIAFVILAGLGTWQVQRLHWKEALIASVEARRNEAPLTLTAALRRADPQFSRVTLDCPGLATAPFVELYAIIDGQAGSRLVSACRPADGPPVLIDRGFVADTISARPPVAPSAQPFTVEGALRAGETPGAFTPPARDGRFYTRDIPGMAAALHAPGALPFMIAAETSTNPQWAALVPSPLPVEISNRHLGYIITWYGLAAALVAVYAAALWRWIKAR